MTALSLRQFFRNHTMGENAGIRAYCGGGTLSLRALVSPSYGNCRPELGGLYAARVRAMA